MSADEALLSDYRRRHGLVSTLPMRDKDDADRVCLLLGPSLEGKATKRRHMSLSECPQHDGSGPLHVLSEMRSNVLLKSNGLKRVPTTPDCLKRALS
jgi:hypothetical protein